jgi:hypothetical protein
MRSQRTSSSAVGCGQDAGGDNLFAACPFARLLGQLHEQIEPGVDRNGQAEPDRALRAGGSGVSGGI